MGPAQSRHVIGRGWREGGGVMAQQYGCGLGGGPNSMGVEGCGGERVRPTKCKSCQRAERERERERVDGSSSLGMVLEGEMMAQQYWCGLGGEEG